MQTKEILTTKYVEPTRPYCNRELNDLRKLYLDKLNLDLPHVFHNKCGHKYLCKKYGKKKQQMKDDRIATVPI